MEDGQHVPLHAGGSAKAILAFMHDEEVEAAMSNTMEKLTDKTITDRAIIEKELELIRNYGYATSVEEISEGAAGIAMPIFDSSHDVIGSVGIIGPTDRFLKLDTEVLVRYLKNSTDEITRNLGG